VLTGTSLREECIESIIASTDGFVTWHLTIRLNAVLEAKELPARIANLNTALSKVKAENLTHDYKVELKRKARCKIASRSVT
jgi:hypothetical protein